MKQIWKAILTIILYVSNSPWCSNILWFFSFVNDIYFVYRTTITRLLSNLFAIVICREKDFKRKIFNWDVGVLFSLFLIPRMTARLISAEIAEQTTSCFNEKTVWVPLLLSFPQVAGSSPATDHIFVEFWIHVIAFLIFNTKSRVFSTKFNISW